MRLHARTTQDMKYEYSKAINRDNIGQTFCGHKLHDIVAQVNIYRHLNQLSRLLDFLLVPIATVFLFVMLKKKEDLGRSLDIEW